MWRDRTNLYISYRQSYAHHPAARPQHASATGNRYSDVPEERRGLMATGGFEDDGDMVIEMDRLPPRWADVSDEVTDLLSEIARKSQSLDKLHQKHVLPGFDDDDVKRREEREIERLTQDITRGFHECQSAIKRVELMVKESRETGDISKGEETMAKNIQISLAGRVQEASALFRKKQATYLKKLRGLGGFSSPMDRSSTPLPSYTSTFSTDPSLLESDADKSFSQSTIQQTAQKTLRTNDTAIIQREKEITEIAQGIIELADIFRDLQAMVIDQGTMLDRIDYNVERMATDVKAAEKELKVATTYQRKTVKRKIILLLVIIVAGLFILVLIKPKHRGEVVGERPDEPGAQIPPTGPDAQAAPLAPPPPLRLRALVDSASGFW